MQAAKRARGRARVCAAGTSSCVSRPSRPRSTRACCRMRRCPSARGRWRCASSRSVRRCYLRGAAPTRPAEA
eukprot:5512626-Prymnesium_polylepis.1